MKTFPEILAYCKKSEIPQFRGQQIFHAVYKEGIASYGQMTALPLKLRTRFAKDLPILSFEKTFEVESKTGDTIKTLFRLSDGKLVEGVLMRFRNGRNSVCLSSQVGCGLKCAFCATGTMGFTRNLSAEEMVDQVLYFQQRLMRTEKMRVTHVIFMGMGEPFLNYENVIESIRRMNDPEGLGLAARRITVSTSGIVPSIEKFADFPLQANLAVSIHAPLQELREKLMPIARAYPLDRLIASIQKYGEKTRRRVSYEYVMLRDINDHAAHARALAKLIRGQRAHVNLIPYNETYLGFHNAGKSHIDRFREILISLGIPATVRVSLGQDISAACGQLAVRNKKNQM